MDGEDLKDIKFDEVWDRDYKDDGPITRERWENIWKKFGHKFRDTRLFYNRVVTVEELEKRREAVNEANMP